MKTLLLLLLTLPGIVWAQGGLPTQPYIYVEGKAEIEKSADFVTLSFDVVARAPGLPKANADVQAEANKVFAMLKEGKVDDKDVIAQDLRSEPQFEKEENHSQGKIIGYTMTRPFQIKVRDIKAFPKLVDDLIAIGGIEFGAINGGLSKENETENAIWNKAVGNAREQAEKTLKATSMKIDSVFAISPVPIPEILSTMFPKKRAVGAAAGINSSSKMPTAEELGPSQYRVPPISITQIVHVIYLISPAK